MKHIKFWFHLKKYKVKIVLVEKNQKFNHIDFLLVAMTTKNPLFMYEVLGNILYRLSF